MDKKLLTISIAAYNVQNYITETLTPFLDEKYNETLEVFVIDDGGKDSTAQIAKGFADRNQAARAIVQDALNSVPAPTETR